MTQASQDTTHQTVACELCLKEVPASEAVVPEAGDYVAYFCGLDCYQRWHAKLEQENATAARAAPTP